MTLRHAALTLALLLALPSTAAGELANFDAAGKIYTKWLYRNDDRQGVLSLGNPFWPENFSGNNGVGGEFELTLTGRASKAVTAGVRLKSRFGAVWHDWWENGNLKYSEPNTSGESLGMDHAEHIKLRGEWIRLKPPIPTVRYILVGSSDLSQFDEWTIGKVRYIDRDNGKGLFVDGSVGSATAVEYHAAAIALPKLWVGPGWSTGIGDPAVEEPFWTQDWAYAGKIKLVPDGDWSLTGIVSLTNDLEVDLADPDAVGTRNPEGNRDHAVDLDVRYRNIVSTLFWQADATDFLSTSVLLAHSSSRINEGLMANGVAENAGVYPLIYKDTGGDIPEDMAWRARAEWADPWDVGLSLSAEYFHIGEDWTSIFGARREADVLLTDGLVEGGQLPTLNLANEFIDFDEAWYETIIGWHGGTALLDWEVGRFGFGLEATGITYTTNSQARDVDSTYPTFQHSEGYTDTDLYDYSNRLDRGRDPRSAYREDQDRLTWIGVSRLRWALGAGIDLEWKLKGIFDIDKRRGGAVDDDYEGSIAQTRLALTAPLAKWASLTVGGQLERWFETNRSGSPNLGYEDYETDKEKAFLSLKAEFGGARLAYYIEYLGKEQRRERHEDQLWRVVRSKAAMEVAW